MTIVMMKVIKMRMKRSIEAAMSRSWTKRYKELRE